MAEERESFKSQWAPSDVTEENLKEMVAHDVLPTKEIIGWRPAFGEAFPTPDTHEIVVFSHFFYGGFSLPTSRFFQGILNFYGISLHHLNPNSIVHIANFVHACEAFLGIRPHFAFFRRIFFLKPQPNKSKPCVVGGAGFQLRGTLSQKYFSMPFKTSNKGWHANWFYVQNPEPALPEYTCLPPVYQDTWNSLPTGDEAAQAVELMERMIKLKEQGLQGELITRHFIKIRLAPIKERSRTAFEFDGKHDPNREDPDSLNFKVMKERMYKIFSNAIVVSYSHLLPVVPFNAFNPPPPPASQIHAKGSWCQVTTKAILLESLETERQPRNCQSRLLQGRKHPVVLCQRSGSLPGIEPTNEDQPSDSQPATDNVGSGDQPPTENESAEAGAGVNQEPPTENQSDTRPSQEIPEVGARADSPRRQDASNDTMPGSPIKAQESTRPRPEIITVDTLGPMIGDEEEIPRIQAAEDSHPPILVKWWDDDRQPQGIVINKQKEDEEVCLLIKAFSQATRIVNRIHLRNEAKTMTLEKLVPHLGTLEATKSQLHEVRELARKTEHGLRNRISELQESNYELSGSSKERQVEALEKDKAELAKQRDLALKDVEDCKIKSQAQFDVLINKINRLEGARDKVANAATPLIQAMFFNNASPSSLDASEIFDKLRVAPDTYFKNIREAGNGTSEETALNLINDVQKAADKIAADIVERFQDGDLRATGSDNFDDEKTDTD
uniref:Retrotransposon protein, putative, unclassified n=1 Tax=Oryza sativa subsp. japonica TaxID=39947 RepID=Q2QRQ7_ORYSJ|nr:retrotransposon protein, putative, unclassified [Oryza sativa Japonica Group]